MPKRTNTTTKLTKRVIDGLSYPHAPGSKKRFQVMDTVVQGFGVRVYGTGRKVFILRYTAESGQRRFISLGDFGPLTVDHARRMAQEKVGQVVQGDDPADLRAARLGAPTVEALCDEFLERYSRPHKKSWKDDESRIERFIKPSWGKRNVTAVSDNDVTALRDEIGSEHPVAANRTVTLVHTIWVKGEEWGRLPQGTVNPAKGVAKFPERSRERWLTPAEVARIFAAVDAEVWEGPRSQPGSMSSRCLALLAERGPMSATDVAATIGHPRRQTGILLASLVHQGRLRRVDRGVYAALPDDERVAYVPGLLLRGLIILYLVTGARKSELLTVRWEHCDLETGRLWIPETKAGRSHTIWLPPQAVEMLKKLPRVVGNPHVFPGRKAGQPLKNVDKAWRRIRERAGVPDVTIHDLRRTVGSWLVQAGTPMPVIKSALNQSTDWAAQVYTRIGNEHVRQAIAEQGRRVFALVGEGA